MDRVKDDMDMHLNYTNAQDHVPVAERNNRMIKEAFRTALHRSGYKKIPCVMIEELALLSMDRLNWVLAKHGVSKYYSLVTIVMGKVLE